MKWEKGIKYMVLMLKRNVEEGQRNCKEGVLLHRGSRQLKTLKKKRKKSFNSKGRDCPRQRE